MSKVSDIFDFLNTVAPVDTQEAFDNAGFLAGSGDDELTRAIIALDVTSDVIDEARRKKAQLIISHHPVIFGKVKNMLADDTTGKKLIALAKNNISVISMHTNLDKAEGGVNDCLISRFMPDSIDCVEEDSYIRIGEYREEIPFDVFLGITKNVLNSKGLRYYNSGKAVKKFACTGGAGDSGLESALKHGCDTFITADIHYHRFLDAQELGINLIDADHFCTENPVVFALKEMLDNQFDDVDFIVSEKHHQIIDFY